MDEQLRASFRDIAIPVPTRVASDPQELHDPRRYDVPVTIITCEFTSDQLREWIAEGHPWMAELAAVKDVTYVDLPTDTGPSSPSPRNSPMRSSALWARHSPCVTPRRRVMP